jgi:hypothetical protein
MFVPTRKFISEFTIEESIDEFVLQSVSSWFESGAALPRFNSSRDLEPIFELKAQQVYDELDIDFGLPPDLITYLALTRKDPADVAAVRSFLHANARA